MDAEGVLHHLARYCSYRGLTPQEVVEFQIDKKMAQDNLEDYLRRLKVEGKAPATVKMAMSGAKSWLSRFGNFSVYRLLPPD